jgi:GH15 family glucan-1,4-alpha-glucosidase
LTLLTYAPTGAIVATPTTSLPEEFGSDRNGDYRYTWVRGAALTMEPLLSLGFSDEPRAFGHFLETCLRSGPAKGTRPLQVLYGIDGRTQIPEETLDHLDGYRGSRPVRIGNDAANQLQLDIYGEIIDTVDRLDQHTSTWRTTYGARSCQPPSGHATTGTSATRGYGRHGAGANVSPTPT